MAVAAWGAFDRLKTDLFRSYFETHTNAIYFDEEGCMHYVCCTQFADIGIKMAFSGNPFSLWLNLRDLQA